MDMFGYPMYPTDLLPTAPMVTGYLPIRGGHGSLIIHGDGRLFTMVAGTPILCMAQYGFQVTNGVRDGFAGEDRKVITVGRLWDPVSVLILLIAADIICQTISGDL